MDCDDVCPAVDRHKWDCETCGGRLLLSFYEVFYGAMHVLHDLVLLLLRHWRPNGLSDGIKIDELSKLFCRGQFSWTKDISGNCLPMIKETPPFPSFTKMWSVSAGLVVGARKVKTREERMKRRFAIVGQSQEPTPGAENHQRHICDHSETGLLWAPIS